MHTADQLSSVSYPSYSNLGSEINGLWLTARGQADITIVSPDSRADALVVNTFAGPALPAGALPEIRVGGPGHVTHIYQLPGRGTRVRIPIHLDRGVNRLVLSPGTSAVAETNPAEAGSESQMLMEFTHLSLASG